VIIYEQAQRSDGALLALGDVTAYCSALGGAKGSSSAGNGLPGNVFVLQVASLS
jgi:hypothetical protein